MADRLLNPGDTFEGRYRVESVIGKGGFGRVYLASQTDLKRRVALKVMRPPQPDQQDPEIAELGDRTSEFAARFEQEANLVCQLQDPHTVRVYDYGEALDGSLYMVLEYIDGETLHGLLENEGPLEPARVVKILRQMLSSLHEAHALGVLHRDIKPGNVMVYEHVGRTDLVKVLDFGLAKAVRKHGPISESDLTRSGILIGTPRYMSPEQIRGEELTPAADLYCVGLVAYEMLVGERAVTAETPMVIVSKHLDARSIRVPNDDAVPGRLRETVNKLLRKNPERRHQSAQEVLDDLENWSDDTAGDETVSGIVPFDGGATSSDRDARAGGRPVSGIVAFVAVLLIAGLAVAYAFTRDSARPAPISDSARAERVPPTAPAETPTEQASAEQEKEPAPAVPAAETTPSIAETESAEDTDASTPDAESARAKVDDARAGEGTEAETAEPDPSPRKRVRRKRRRPKKKSDDLDLVPLE